LIGLGDASCRDTREFSVDFCGAWEIWFSDPVSFGFRGEVVFIILGGGDLDREGLGSVYGFGGHCRSSTARHYNQATIE
jgi:hypothetical protein